MVWTIFTILLAACIAAGSTGMLFPTGAWYRDLNKPAWTPPGWMFPVVWTTLYILIAIAGARVAFVPGSGLAMAFWALQIALNTLWTPVFFGLHRIRTGMAIIVALWLAVAGGTAAMFHIDMIAGLLFLPYLVWVTLAGALNLSIWRRNPEAARG